MKIIESENTKNIYISLNYHCNNQCIMCGVPLKKHGMYNEDIDFYIAELKKIPFEINENDIITLSGGEPFLFKEIFEFIEFIRSNYKCRITIFTNGRMLRNKEYVRKVEKYKIDKLVIPYFSYDEETFDLIAGTNGAYQEWMQALENLENTSLYYELKFLPMRQNYLHMYDSYIFSKKVFPKSHFVICGVQYFGEAVTNAEWMGIKYSRLKEEIERTFDYGKEYYQEDILLYRFPMCVIDAKYNNHGVLTLFKEFIIGPDYSDVNKSTVKKIEMPEICNNCRSFCDWYPTKYGKIYGFGELSKL